MPCDNLKFRPGRRAPLSLSPASHMIKICGITNLQDAIAAVAAGVDAIGFNFYAKSKRYISVPTAAMISHTLPRAVLRVGVFVNESPEIIREIADRAGLQVAQLHGDETPAGAPSGIRIWKAFRVDSPPAAGFRLESALSSFPLAEAFLLDGPAGDEYGGSGKPFLWQIASGSPRPIILAGGLNAANVQDAIAAAHPWGVDACSLLESAPGRKDHQQMKLFVSAARAAEVAI